MTETDQGKQKKVRYLTSDREFSYDNPEVIQWTEYFADKARKGRIYDRYEAALSSEPNHYVRAQEVATSWDEFTRFVPVFLSRAVTLAKKPDWQHYLIQIAYEELGGRHKNKIHSKLFTRCLADIGLKTIDREYTRVSYLLDTLETHLVKTRSQHGILGLMLSLEICALENIESLFNGIGFDANAKEILDRSFFFRIHRADETEHIRHSVANFLRFCHTDQEQGDFHRTFEQGLYFWRAFWEQIADDINEISNNQEPQKRRA